MLQICVNLRGYKSTGECVYNRYEVGLHYPQDLSADITKRIEAFRATNPEIVRLTWDVAI